MSKKLKPCPLCGYYDIRFVTHRRGISLYCSLCSCSTDIFDTKKVARENWNTRPAENELSAKIIRLQNQVEELKDMVHELDPDRVLEWNSREVEP